MTPKVSIVIACYNDPDIVKAVNSAYEQTYGNKEIIVVNDGSDKKTVDATASVSDKIDILLEQSNQGQSIARNNGIERASGELILNLDSDDQFEPVFCEKAVEIFKEDPEIKIVSCYARRYNESETIDVFNTRGGDIQSFLFSNSALGSSMFRKVDWKACGGYEEKLPILGFEDWELYVNILKKGGFAHVIPEVLFHYQVRKGSTTDRIRTQKYDKFRHIILKHKELYSSNFEGLVEHFIDKLKNSESERLRITQKPDFKAGSFLLRPLRFLKGMIK
ncbi:glycosyl transferase family 2 [Gramella sp. Hel_I_59]|uniref:glycosyltransferase family 2 protein n=1 Tax=Gramella sp. Hel_I_59 TaxID=1249978 RepID=UPI00114F5200|nr:glycosyltransferase family A protein [Gramella sp. Hel_I_59]TQI71540.1 glycosyl transferase family 2 [Gramella sp. Hel_I_59]